MPTLELPRLEYIPSYIAALREGYVMGTQDKKTDAEISAIEKNPQEFLDRFFTPKTGPVILPNGEKSERVPQTTLWYMDGHEFVGEASIRHRLTPALEIYGGHIGYGVRPSAQGRGHATALLRAAATYAHDKVGVDKVLITVADDNPASIKVIEKNGGMRENTLIRPFDGSLGHRYWIHL